MDVLDRARLTIRRHQLATADTRVVAALSGGSDSTALTHLLRELDRDGELRLAGVAHFNHQLRVEADAEERFCRESAEALDLPFVAGRDDVGRLARDRRTSVETAARDARHAFFERARVELGADIVATGHTADDQAETFLLRLVRGAGSKGLGAMYPRSGAIVRPLLDCRRAALCAYLDARAIRYVHDASNDDVAIPRNRVRVELMPLLEQRFNPRIVEVLAGEAAVARDEHALLALEVETWWQQFARAEHGGVSLDAAALLRAPAAVGRLVLRRAMTTAAGTALVGFDDLDRAFAVARGASGPLDAPGHRVQRIGDAVVLTGRSGGSGRPSWATPVNLFAYPLSIPGEVLVPEADCALSSEVVSPWGGQISRLAGSGPEAIVQLGLETASLAVRNRRPGDRFHPLGATGRKKLQDYFVDRKVARGVRDRVPIVVDQTDRIVWVAGHTIDESFRVTDAAQAVIILRLKGVGGSA